LQTLGRLTVERGSLCSDRIVAAFSVIAFSVIVQWIDGALGIDKVPQLLAEGLRIASRIKVGSKSKAWRRKAARWFSGILGAKVSSEQDRSATEDRNTLGFHRSLLSRVQEVAQASYFTGGLIRTPMALSSSNQAALEAFWTKLSST
jgi:hypothetical protein